MHCEMPQSLTEESTAHMPIADRSSRWVPTTETDLNAAIRDGVLDETHHQDMKRALETGSPSKNVGFARDLAAFAIDGGTIIIGVAEDKNLVDDPFSLQPQPLNGLAERVESIARSLVDPPLAVTSDAIPSAADPRLGYLVVTVPPSGRAPHMVRGTYYGRGDKTNHPLSDSEVARLIRLRERRELDIEALLGKQIARDPIPQADRLNARLFVVARPVYPHAEMALAYTHGPGSTKAFQALLNGAMNRTKPPEHVWSQNLASGLYADLRADGKALVSEMLKNRAAPDLTNVDRWGEHAVEFEVTENGELHAFDSSLTLPRPNVAGVIRSVALPCYARMVVHAAADLSEACGYTAEWELGVAGVGLADKVRESGWSRDSGVYGSVYGEDAYLKGTVASAAELAQAPGTVTRRLTGQFLRALGRLERYEGNLLADPE